EAVDQVESLTTGLSRGIWQKLMILERVIEQSEREMMVKGEEGAAAAEPPKGEGDGHQKES
ncbi:MAG: hypothetical protein KDA36_07095, partial [Planctomycetaceae bacterium]|nr:hypothetical protein [Planctomycetaceae bacterium]